MIIGIKVYGQNAFTKYGKLKKKARSQMSRMMVDIEPYTPNAVDSFLTGTARELAKDYDCFESPYIFTNINARNKDTGETVRIFETCNDMLTSPVKLLALLK
jgi:hypothetical protein